MFWLIFAIYVLITGKLELRKNYGLRGTQARLSILYTFIATIVVAVIFNSMIIVSAIAQIAMLFVVPLVMVAIIGNQFAPKSTEPEKVKKSTKAFGVTVNPLSIIIALTVLVVGSYLIYINYYI